MPNGLPDFQAVLKMPTMPYTYEYPRPAVTLDVVVVAGTEGPPLVLLIRRGRAPFKDQWALPGGFLDMEEDLMDGALRELKEETGLSLSGLVQFATYGSPGRDPRGRTVSVVYSCRLPGPPPDVLGGDDAAQAAWFPWDKLPSLAFDHDRILHDFFNQPNGFHP